MLPTVYGQNPAVACVFMGSHLTIRILFKVHSTLRRDVLLSAKKVELSIHDLESPPPLFLGLRLAAPLSQPACSDCVGSSVWQAVLWKLFSPVLINHEEVSRDPHEMGMKPEGQDETSSPHLLPQSGTEARQLTAVFRVQSAPHPPQQGPNRTALLGAPTPACLGWWEVLRAPRLQSQVG